MKPAGSDSSDGDLVAVRLPNLDLHRRQHVGTRVTVSDLTVVVAAPAPDVAVRSQRARVRLPGAAATGSDFGDVDLAAVRLPNLDLLWRQHIEI